MNMCTYIFFVPFLSFIYSLSFDIMDIEYTNLLSTKYTSMHDVLEAIQEVAKTTGFAVATVCSNVKPIYIQCVHYRGGKYRNI